jgi:NMD protein affecting ribosome stability and mRNA decay
MSKADFVAHKHPVLAVKCPHCSAKPGSWCIRPSNHKATELHLDRKTKADEVFVEMYGEEAGIERLPNGGWKIHLTGLVKEKSTASK